ncbi:MAG: type II secretion system F family protein, partial [Candidatus Omnitrophica bacterium]|nr:type II secretion system F family protein [Candidatus Omnitrophota bacterium]
DDAINIINQLGLLPVSIVEEETKRDGKKIVLARKVRTKELYVFSKQLVNLLRAGVSLLKALTIIEEQTSNQYFRKIIYYIVQGVRNGKSFSECISEYKNIFPYLYVTMVRAGEESGNLQEMLSNVSKHLQRQEDIASKIRMAMAYPIFMAVVGVATICFILTFVLPKMSSLFETMGDSLPLVTVILIKVSAFLSKWWAWVIIAVLSIAFGFQQWGKTKIGRFASSKAMLRLPFFGELVLKSELTRFSTTLLLLIKSGIPLVRALGIATPVINNDLLKLQLKKCEQDIISGGSLGETLKASSEIPVMMGHLISIGEESGSLNDVLAEVAETYEQEIDEKIKMTTTLLEPVMILVVGFIVGFIVFAMLLPIFQVDVFA